MTFDAASWHDYFLMVGGGAAALTGLVFVAMSLHLDQIALNIAHRHRARTVLTGLTAVFIRCALVLMAGQSAQAIALELILVLVGVEIILFLSIRQAMRASEAADPALLWRTIGSFACLVTEQLGAVVLFTGDARGLYAVGVGMMASSVTVPVVGKLSDLFGRRPFYIAGLVLFLVGSAASGFSQNMSELIAARAVTGIGGGAMMALGATTVGDIFSPRERGRWMGLIMSVFGLGSIVGPLVGGFITDHFGWRWVFYVNLPLGLVALASLVILLPRLRGRGQVRIDWPGIVLLVSGVLPILIGLTWAGITYPWASVQVIGALGIGAIQPIALAVSVERAAE